MLVIGIDVGLKGGVAVVNTRALLYAEEFKFKKETYFEDCLSKLNPIVSKYSKYKNSICYMENVHAFPRQGVVSTFTSGVLFGLSYAVMRNAFNVKLVNPRTWQSYFGILDSKHYGKCNSAYSKRKKRKKLSIKCVSNLYPAWKDRITKDGVADAVLIATYGIHSEVKNLAKLDMYFK